jgi:DNA-binding NarL/FixJ family response regulator
LPSEVRARCASFFRPLIYDQPREEQPFDGNRRPALSLQLLHACRVTPSPLESAPPCPGVDQLSPREQKVARRVAERLTNRQVARALHISEPTVKFHLKQVFRKLGISCRSRLAYLLLPMRKRAMKRADAS